jgi:hypothetical protein
MGAENVSVVSAVILHELLVAYLFVQRVNRPAKQMTQKLKLLGHRIVTEARLAVCLLWVELAKGFQPCQGRLSRAGIGADGRISFRSVC